MTEPNAPEAKPEPEPAAPSAPTAPEAPAERGPELLGGRLLIGVAMLVAMGIISWQGFNVIIDRALHPKAPKPVVTWEVGKEADLELTLITPDAQRLQCAHDTAFEGVHCGYTANKRPWRRTPKAPLDDNDEDIIQPYRTADTNALVLVSGLWAQPELALRLHREPPNVADVDKNLRFVAYCHVRFIGELEKVSLRWDTRAKWGEEAKAIVAKPTHCTLQPPNG